MDRCVLLLLFVVVREDLSEYVPNSHTPYIAGCLLLEESANLLDLGSSAGRVKE